jgi:hypothetical protein
MTDKDDEIIVLLREVVAAVKENSTQYADAVKKNRGLFTRNQIIAFGALIFTLIAFHFHWLP